MAGGLMEFLKSPAFGTYLSGLGQGLVKADRGQGFDMGNTPQIMAQMMQQRQQQEKFRGLMENLGQNLTPEQRQYLEVAGPETGMPLLGQQMFGQEKKYALDRKIEALMGTGLDRGTATNIATGRFVTSRDPITGVAQVVDKATGQPVGQVPAQVADIAEADTDGGQPAGGAQPTEGFGVPDNADYTEALGVEGVFKGAVNWLSDIAGQGLVYENADKVANTLNNLQVRTQTMLQDAVPGRPSNYLLQKIEGLTVTPNSLRQGPEGAVNTLKDTRQIIADAIRENEEIMQSRVDPNTASKARASNVRLQTLLQQYEQIIAAMQQGGGQQGADTPEPGIVEDGYRFLGGDPADPNSWEKVQ